MSENGASNGHGSPNGSGKPQRNGRSKATSTNGRSHAGRFKPGNPGGPGNPYASKVQAVRAELYKALTKTRMRKVLKALLTAAEKGEPWAVREVLDRGLGKPSQAHFMIQADRDEAGGSLTPAQADAVLAVLGGDGDAEDAA